MAIMPRGTDDPPAVPIPLPRRDPTAVRAISRTTSSPVPAAPVPVLRRRLVHALGVDDGHGALLLAGHLRRAVG